MQANEMANGTAQAVTVERLEHDANGLTSEQRMAAVMADAPELAALLSELQASLAEVRHHVDPVLKEVAFPASANAVQCNLQALWRFLYQYLMNTMPRKLLRVATLDQLCCYCHQTLGADWLKQQTNTVDLTCAASAYQDAKLHTGLPSVASRHTSVTIGYAYSSNAACFLTRNPWCCVAGLQCCCNCCNLLPWVQR